MPAGMNPSYLLATFRTTCRLHVRVVGNLSERGMGQVRGGGVR